MASLCQLLTFCRPNNQLEKIIRRLIHWFPTLLAYDTPYHRLWPKCGHELWNVQEWRNDNSDMVIEVLNDPVCVLFLLRGNFAHTCWFCFFYMRFPADFVVLYHTRKCIFIYYFHINIVNQNLYVSVYFAVSKQHYLTLLWSNFMMNLVVANHPF